MFLKPKTTHLYRAERLFELCRGQDRGPYYHHDGSAGDRRKGWITLHTHGARESPQGGREGKGPVTISRRLARSGMGPPPACSAPCAPPEPPPEPPPGPRCLGASASARPAPPFVDLISWLVDILCTGSFSAMWTGRSRAQDHFSAPLSPQTLAQRTGEMDRDGQLGT